MMGRKFKLEISGWWEQKDKNYCYAKKSAMKCSTSLDTRKAFSILTFTMPAYLHCPLLLGQTTLRIHGNVNSK